jgi:hypothetical protein
MGGDARNVAAARNPAKVATTAENLAEVAAAAGKPAETTVRVKKLAEAAAAAEGMRGGGGDWARRSRGYAAEEDEVVADVPSS